jgi:hypothetical protein
VIKWFVMVRRSFYPTTSVRTDRFDLTRAGELRSLRGQYQSTPDSDESERSEDRRERDAALVRSVGRVQQVRTLHPQNTDTGPLAFRDADVGTAAEQQSGERDQFREDDTDADDE